MPDIKIEIKNLPQIKRAFGRAPALMRRHMNIAIRKSILTIQRESMIHTPVDTGRLRASHTTSFGDMRAELFPTAFYAPFVHEGTRFMKARPFLANAVQSQQSQVNKFFAEETQTVLNQIGRDT